MQPKNTKSLNTNVYIDGFNLYYSLKNTPYKWLNIEKLVKSVINNSLYKILHIKYFTATPKVAESAYRHGIYIKALETLPNIKIIYGQFKKRQVKGKDLNTNNIRTISKWEEKKSDVNIATHIVYDCCKENIDCIVLLSNDTDLTTPLYIARYKLKKIINVITPTKRVDSLGESIEIKKNSCRFE